ncbi:MAG: DUF2953 domain-containing protein [Oscillospiraceae bacterium]|nr:DUF2953 domain-containing protein [Oscillospiraceae bacterium]
MTGWIIFGCIVLFLIILFRQSVTVTVDYENKLDLKVKFLFFTIYPTKPKKQKKVKKKKEKEEKAEPPPEAPPEPPSEEKKEEKPEKKKKKFSIDIEMIMDYVESAWPPIKKLFKKIRWYDVYVDWVVASDDAAKTALMYGSICSFLYPFFKWLTTYFTAHVKEVNIEPDFSRENQDIFIYFVLKLRLSTALACVIWLAWRVLKTYLKYSQSSAPAQKSGKKSKRKGKKQKSVKKGK